MTIRDASFQILEVAINNYLSLDPEISEQLSSMHGASIGFDLTGTAILIYFIPSQNGQIQLLSQIEGEADCLIKGSPFSLLRSSKDENAQQVFSGDVEIIGNSSLAQQFTHILKQIDVDWEEQLSKITGDVIAHQIGNVFRNADSWLMRFNQTSKANMQEYLQEEARLLPGIYELENFYHDVDQLRDDTERLAARIARLEDNREQQ